MNGELRALIQASVGEHPKAGPEEVAHYVAQNTPAEELMGFYRALLVGACRTVINQERRGTKPHPAPRAKPSAKLQDRRSWWAQMLDVEMFTAGGSKPLGDCTVTDLRFCIKDREQHIEHVENQLHNLRQIVALMGRHRVNTVRELPAQQQFGRAS